jgi:12,18-didecarboxysiroheme deacetylase
MIGIAKLYCGTVEPSDVLRYGGHSSRLPSHLLQFSLDKRPVVVWNCTRRCNLGCVHCYSGSADRQYPGELTTGEASAMLGDLAEFGVPVVLFSGGEPLLRPDVPDLAQTAVKLGMRAVLSTNGTLIDPPMARRLAGVGLSYVGISLDGMRDVNDRFRGKTGAFDAAMAGAEAAREAGIKVGLRLTLTRHNVDQLDSLFDLMRDHGIPRVCFYHLVYAGRGAALQGDDLDAATTRAAIDRIIDRTAALHARGQPVEVLTVDNHADGPYLYLRMLRENSPRAPRVLELLRLNGGNSSGVGIGCISWDGSVHPDQFWRHDVLGNVRDVPFSRIWTDTSSPLMARLKDKKRHVGGRCATCRFLEICGGNSRVRARAATGDTWAADPACYLTDGEIAP